MNVIDDGMNPFDLFVFFGENTVDKLLHVPDFCSGSSAVNSAVPAHGVDSENLHGPYGGIRQTVHGRVHERIESAGSELDSEYLAPPSRRWECLVLDTP